MTTIPGTDLTTEAARNRASRMLNEHDAALMVALADALDGWSDPDRIRDDTLTAVIARAKNVADRDKYSPKEAAAAWDVVDALQTLRTTGEHVTADPEADDRDGKTITRAAEAEDTTDECD